MLPFHRKVVRDPAFTAEDGTFGVFTRWIETEFVNDIPPWDGELDGPKHPEARHTVVVEVGGKRLEVSLPDRVVAGSAAAGRPAAVPPSRRSHSPTVVAGASGDAVKSPMQATIVKVAVEDGQQVVKGDLVVVLEAMKMEQPIQAHKDGVIGVDQREPRHHGAVRSPAADDLLSARETDAAPAPSARFAPHRAMLASPHRGSATAAKCCAEGVRRRGRVVDDVHRRGGVGDAARQRRVDREHARDLVDGEPALDGDRDRVDELGGARARR